MLNSDIWFLFYNLMNISPLSQCFNSFLFSNLICFISSFSSKIISINPFLKFFLSDKNSFRERIQRIILDYIHDLIIKESKFDDQFTLYNRKMLVCGYRRTGKDTLVKMF